MSSFKNNDKLKIEIEEKKPFMDPQIRIETINKICTTMPYSGIVPGILEEFEITGDEILDHKLFEKVCSVGNLELAKYLADFYCIKPTHIQHMEERYVSEIIHKGYFEVIKWLEEEYNILRYYRDSRVNINLVKFPSFWDEFSGCCANGPLEMVKWYVKTFNITKEKFYMIKHLSPFEAACSAGKILNAKWLARHFRIAESEYFSGNSHKKRPILFKICDNRKELLDVIAWFVNEFKLTKQDIETYKVQSSIINCCKLKHLESAKWLANHFEISRKDMSLRSKNYQESIFCACINGDIEVLKWIIKEFKIENDRPLFISCFIENIGLCNIESSRYIMNTFDLNIRKVIPEPLLMVENIICGPTLTRIPMLKWFQKQYNYSFIGILYQFKEERIGILGSIFSDNELKNIKWFVENFDIKKAIIYPPLIRKERDIIPLSKAYEMGSLRVVKWLVKYFSFNKKEILESLTGLLNSPIYNRCILKYLKTKFGITKDDIKANNYYIFRRLLKKIYTFTDQSFLVLFIEIFNISPDELLEAIKIAHNKGITIGSELERILFFSYNII